MLEELQDTWGTHVMDQKWLSPQLKYAEVSVPQLLTLAKNPRKALRISDLSHFQSPAERLELWGTLLEIMPL